MDDMLIEKLINFRKYEFELFYELPVEFSASSRLELNAWVKDAQQLFSLEGLLIKGTISEKIGLISEVASPDQDQRIFYFTFLIPDSDLKTKNLLNIDCRLQISQLNYHLIKKKGRVFLKQKLKMDLELHEYAVEKAINFSLEGLEKKTGAFLKKFFELEKSFLKSYAIDLPVDFLSLKKISGKVDNLVFERIQDGCLLDFVARLQGEYLNTRKQIGMFFFEKREHFFIPFPELSSSSPEEIKVLLDLKELSLEKDRKLLLLYQCEIDFYQKSEVMYYTGDIQQIPAGSKVESYEIEEMSLPLKASQIFNEKKKLGHLDVSQILRISGELIDVKIDEVKIKNIRQQLLISGQIDYICLYLDESGVEKTIFGKKQIEQLMAIGDVIPQKTGYWTLESLVTVPTWELTTTDVSFEIIIDFQAFFHYFIIQPILISLPYGQQKRERLYLLQQISADQIYFPAEEKIYLQRYAKQISQIENKILEWQKRQVAGGWLVSGNGEFVIYYLTAEGEFHFLQTFSFSHYLPTENVWAKEIRLQPQIQILDMRLLEDGSLVRIEYLLWLKYQLLQRKEEWVVLEIKLEEPKATRPIFKMDKLEQRLEKLIPLKKGKIFADQVKKVENLELKIGDYQWQLTNQDLKITGDIEVQMRYLNTRGRRFFKIIPVQFAFNESIDLEGQAWSDENIRLAPQIKNYQYLLNAPPAYPQKEIELYLCIQLEINYRILGNVNF